MLKPVSLMIGNRFDQIIAPQESISLADIAQDFNADLDTVESIIKNYMPQHELIHIKSVHDVDITAVPIETYIRFLRAYAVMPDDETNEDGRSQTTTASLAKLGINDIYKVDVNNLMKILKS